MKSSYSPKVLDLLHKAGWYEGRDVLVDFDNKPLRIFPLAQAILQEFGGLHIGTCDVGIDKAKSDLFFPSRYVDGITPDEIEYYSRHCNTLLYPLAAVHVECGYLLIDSSGRMYLLSDELQPLALKFVDAMESLLLGKTPIESFEIHCKPYRLEWADEE